MPLPRGGLADLPTFPRHGGLIHPKPARKKPCVGGDLLTRGKKDTVTHHQLLHGKGAKGAVPPYADKTLLALLGEPTKGRLATPLGEGGDQGGQKDRQTDPHRLVKIASPKDEKKLNGKGEKQHANNGIVEIPEKMTKKALLLFLGQTVFSMLLAGAEDLCLGKTPWGRRRGGSCSLTFDLHDRFLSHRRSR
jgi:hypothetical protein